MFTPLLLWLPFFFILIICLISSTKASLTKWFFFADVFKYSRFYLFASFWVPPQLRLPNNRSPSLSMDPTLRAAVMINPIYCQRAQNKLCFLLSLSSSFSSHRNEWPRWYGKNACPWGRTLKWSHQSNPGCRHEHILKSYLPAHPTILHLMILCTSWWCNFCWYEASWTSTWSEGYWLKNFCIEDALTKWFIVDACQHAALAHFRTP